MLCNVCEHLLVCTFAALRLKYVKQPLGTKINTIRNKRNLFESLIGNENLKDLLDNLDITNKYFQLAKHAHVMAYPEIANNQSLLDPDFKYDSLDLIIVDVSTLDKITITPQDRQEIENQINETIKKLAFLKEKAENYRRKCDAENTTGSKDIIKK